VEGGVEMGGLGVEGGDGSGDWRGIGGRGGGGGGLGRHCCAIGVEDCLGDCERGNGSELGDGSELGVVMMR